MNTTKIAIGAALAGAFALGVTVVGFSSARQDAGPSTHSSEKVSTSFSELQENEIRDIVRAYLLENPEVIIEAVNEYSARQQLAEVERTRVVAEQNLTALLDANTGFVAAKDQSKAKVAVVELYDYHCGFCKRATPIINDMVNRDSEIKVVLRELPILREESEYAAEMSLAARDQGKFLAFHNALMEAPGVLSKDRVQEIARDLDLDVAQMELLIAQAFNIFLLYRGAQNQHLSEASAAAVARIVGEMERMNDARYEERRERRWRRGRRVVPLLSDTAPAVPDAKTLRAVTERAGQAFLNMGLSIRKVEVWETARLPAELQQSVIGVGRGRRLTEEIRRPMARKPPPPPVRGFVVVSAQLEDGRWMSVATALRDRNVRALRPLMIQTVVLYLLLLVPLIWIGRYISRPLHRLTKVANDFQPGMKEPVPESGPPDTRQLISAFNAMNERVGAMLDEKDIMLGAIGHDLRTPLAALRVRIENVADDVERERMIAGIEDMDRTLDDILSLARMGRSAEPKEATDISALIETVVDEFDDLGQAVAFRRGDRHVMKVRGVLLRRALRNLISNAIAYGEHALISVEKSGDQLSIIVDDSGPGIPDDKIEAMFDPFARAERSRNRSTGGSGLGLTLARSIARTHGGDVRLENRSEGGLRASIILPVESS